MLESNLGEGLLKTAARDKWKKIGIRRRAGVLVPLFSVYSKNSFGIGDFADLKLIIDWAKATGNSIVQLLPMNEVGINFCPYDSLSSFALEPAYFSFHLFPTARKKSFQTTIAGVKKDFPTGRPYLDYRIKEEKLKILKSIYAEDDSNSAACKKFREENAYWLEDFALFKMLKEYHHGAAWYEWEARYRNRDPAALKECQERDTQEIEFQIWLQWQLYQQFKAIKDYAVDRGVLLKGDLPILVSRDSADVWAHPAFFKLDFAAGAPPDAYCAKGQRWGMPTYDWERIAKDNYRYLKEKLKYAQNFYDILRVDHVVGLFRIWSIPYNEPLENQGLHGFFDPQDEKKWERQGRDILSLMLESTEMLLCAEDLGIIPQVCPQTLKDLGIPGNDVQRWVKDWKIKHDFLAPSDYRFLSVSMLSTHDTTNWPAWWENEAGTVDEKLFVRKCTKQGIDFGQVKNKLFDLGRSRHGRLRWLESVASSQVLADILAKKKEEIGELAEIYENTYQEKEKLWKHLGIERAFREGSDREIATAALKITLQSRSIFCIQSVIDWLYLAEIFTGDAYQYRINTPGTVNEKNWSLEMPISLDNLLRHKVNKEIRRMIEDSQRL